MKRYKGIAMLAVVLLVISVTINIMNYKNAKKYEMAVDSALIYFFTQYKVGSIQSSLNFAIDNKKIPFGESGKSSNYFQRDFNELSNMHRELTLLYAPLYSFNNYDKISSISTHNIFMMLQDFSIFFEFLNENNIDSLDTEDEVLYLNFNEMEDDIIDGISIITEITGELDRMVSESINNNDNDVKKVLEDYLLRSAEYFNTEEVQDKYEVIKMINKKLISQGKGFGGRVMNFDLEQGGNQ